MPTKELSPDARDAKRKLAMAAGILPRPREPNGRAQRSVIKQIEAAERKAQEKEKRVVLSQPHRKGDARQECGSAFGRFILRCPEEHRTALKHAGDEYATATRNWRAAKGVPGNTRSGEIGTGEGPSDAAVARWLRTMVDGERAMEAASGAGRHYIRQLVLDEYDIGLDQDGQALVALEALAVFFGMMRSTRHPFNAA